MKDSDTTFSSIKKKPRKFYSIHKVVSNIYVFFKNPHETPELNCQLNYFWIIYFSKIELLYTTQGNQNSYSNQKKKKKNP